jgi:hypothetical protein
MEANDLIFEFVFLEPLRQDGSGEKGFEILTPDSIFHVERECPGPSRRSQPVLDTSLCPGK